MRAHDGTLRNVCVYCGSASGADPVFEAAARILGTSLAAEGIGLVYGGGGHGLMGTLAKATLDHGGRVTGIIPEALTGYAAQPHANQEQVIVRDMHARKRMMFDRADAIIALPGGIGTLEELVEQLTWVRLGHHSKPIVLANIGGFWRPLLDLLAHMSDHRFLGPPLETRFLVSEQAEDIVPMLRKTLVTSLPLHA